MTIIAVIGLGYVGLPLAIEFGKHYRTIGYDISESKIAAYLNHQDPSNEVPTLDFQTAVHFEPTTDITKIRDADFIIIAMPTPVDENNLPDFGCLINASTMVGLNMKKDCIVIYESTVYPGATEEICIPVLEEHSGMKWIQDFNVGYSPERISPGDKLRTLTKIKKIVSGDTDTTLESIANLYADIIEAGVYKASSIRVAEAAKVIENIQRDVNIALMNELAIIFGKLGIDTNQVIDAASSKWNFVGYRPGLVGGHCIGVDPYYLIHKAKEVGYDPQIITQARVVNNGMAKFIVDETLKLVDNTKPLSIAVLGLTFKEDCKDLRNSKVFDLIYEYFQSGAKVYVHDPLVEDQDVIDEYGVYPVKFEDIPVCDIIVLATPHRELLAIDPQLYLSKLAGNGLLADIKGKLDSDIFVENNRQVWSM